MTTIELGHENDSGDEIIYTVRGTYVPSWRGSRDEPPGGGYHEDIVVKAPDGREVAEAEWPWPEKYIQERLWEDA